MNWQTVLGVVSALGGLTALGALIFLPWQIKKMKADTGKTTADGAAVLTTNALKMLEMLEPAQQEIDRLEARLVSANGRAERLDAALRESQAEVQDLRNQVTAMTKEVLELRAENSTLKGR